MLVLQPCKHAVSQLDCQVAQLPTDLVNHIRTLRSITTKPICIGFGIATPTQSAEVGQIADGVIVGSAIVRMVEQHAGSTSLLTEVGNFIESLKAPLREPRQ